jgi:uncharacterized membrane protein
MASENNQLIDNAKQTLQGKWQLVILTFSVYLIVTLILVYLKYFGSFLSLLINGPFFIGLSIISLKIVRKQAYQTEDIWLGFKEDYKRSSITYVLIAIYVILYALLLIVPGIIKKLSYSMTFFILAEDKTILPEVAMERSKQMMEGHKLQIFYLALRFIGYSIITLGVGVFVLFPLYKVALANFYEEIKTETKNSITI